MKRTRENFSRAFSFTAPALFVSSSTLLERIPPPKAVCPDLLIGFKSMAYVMRYNHFPH